MTFLAYPAYSDSSYGWIGPIPTNWTVTRLKHLARVQTGIAKGKDVAGINTVVMPYLRVANVQDGFINLTDVSTIEVAETDVARYLLQTGDVLMNEGGDFDKLGRGQVWDGSISPCIHQNHVFAVRPYKVEPEWLTMVTTSECGRFFFMSRSKQSTNLASISSSNLLELPVPLPPREDRRRILEFVRLETGKIDALVAEQERLIALLQEKRQAVISQAVTKGLNPKAPMKPSGVEWLGELPAHWEIKRLKQIAGGITVGVVVMPTQYYADQGVPALRSLNVREMVTVTDSMVFFDRTSEAALAKSRLQTDDLVAVRTGKPGTTAVIGPELDGANCVDLIIIRKSVKFASRFVAYFMNSNVCRVQFEAGSEGAIQQHFNIETAGNLRIAVPPVEEQLEIARAMDVETSRIDLLAAEAERSILLLRERRAALISAAVTGKIDVRNLVQPSAEVARAA